MKLQLQCHSLQWGRMNSDTTIVKHIAKNGLNTFRLLSSRDGVYLPVLETEAGLGTCCDQWHQVSSKPRHQEAMRLLLLFVLGHCDHCVKEPRRSCWMMEGAWLCHLSLPTAQCTSETTLDHPAIICPSADARSTEKSSRDLPSQPRSEEQQANSQNHELNKW